PVVMPAGMVGLYTAQQALEYKLADRIEETRFDVMKAYRLPPRSLRGDPLEGRTPHAWRIEVTGQVNGALKEALERRIRRAVSRQANLIILQLECGKGDTQDALDLAEFLRGLMDDAGENHVMTVAYLTEQARDTATYLALGCTEIVMDKQAKLGGFEQLAQENPTHQPMRAQSLKGLAEEQGISALLVQGMLDRDLVIHRVRSKRGRLVRTLLDGKALEEDKALPADQQKWIDEGQIKGQGELLELSATQAEELGVAQLVVDGPSTNSLPVIYAHYGLAPDQVQSAGPDWLDELAAFLSRPVVSVFLVMIGIAGLILELKMPGVGFPGVVSAICFVLYFWAHSRLAGQLTWLAVLLFVLGLILIGLEVFVVPGFGVTGISGIVLVVLSLALATVVKKPETTQEWLRFGGTISTLALSLVAAVVGAFVIAWYLPHIPYANRLVLAPPEIPHEEEEETTRPRDRMMEMLGAIGVAATPLRPAGKARFGEEFVDVVAEGSYVPEGTRVQVVEIEGNRIVVKEV
ncbi:MAG: hypothetical protein JO112_16730, partial [Planctomycetes bacterium]|nr:hypothetical protein [Planctomycetota bacterium]